MFHYMNHNKGFFYGKNPMLSFMFMLNIPNLKRLKLDIGVLLKMRSISSLFLFWGIANMNLNVNLNMNLSRICYDNISKHEIKHIEPKPMQKNSSTVKKKRASFFLHSWHNVMINLERQNASEKVNEYCTLRCLRSLLLGKCCNFLPKKLCFGNPYM